jgi:hypothetical protein
MKLILNKNHLIISLGLLLFSVTQAQDKGISEGALNHEESFSVIASGSGSNQNEAINSALRSCIEKTFGVFISISTEIMNDQIIKDKISTIAQGTIKSYKIVNTSDDGKYVIVAAEISPSRIINVVSAKGYEITLNGSVYSQNALKESFYKAQEIDIIKDFFNKYQSIQFFDFKFAVSKPQNIQAANFEKIEDADFLSNIDSSRSFVLNKIFPDKKKKKELLLPYAKRGILTEPYFPGLGLGNLGGDLFFEYKNTWQYYKLGYLSELKRNRENLHVIQILCTPTFNSNYIQFVKSFIYLLKSVSISDISEYEKTIGILNKIKIENINGFINDLDDNIFYLRNKEALPIIHNFFQDVYFSSTCLNLTSDVYEKAAFLYAELPRFHYEPLYEQQLYKYQEENEITIGPFIRFQESSGSIRYVTFSSSRLIFFFDLNNLSTINNFNLRIKNSLGDVISPFKSNTYLRRMKY